MVATNEAVAGRPPHLEHDQLLQAQAVTLAAARCRYGVLARILFVTLDMLYGRHRTISKFKVLELVARVPYQSREQQDNEQWHLLILEELIAKSGNREHHFYYFWIPQAIAMVYYQISWLLFVIKPKWSYLLNADFEDHAEHEYMLLVAEHPEWEDIPFRSDFAADYGSFGSLADLFRQIGHDERVHKEESIALLSNSRFS